MFLYPYHNNVITLWPTIQGEGSLWVDRGVKWPANLERGPNPKSVGLSICWVTTSYVPETFDWPTTDKSWRIIYQTCSRNCTYLNHFNSSFMVKRWGRRNRTTLYFNSRSVSFYSVPFLNSPREAKIVLFWRSTIGLPTVKVSIYIVRIHSRNIKLTPFVVKVKDRPLKTTIDIVKSVVL